MTEENYPGVLERVKAILVDSIMMVFFMFIITYIFSFSENIPDYLRIMAVVFIFFLYDPLFTSIFGGTIGHLIIGIRVKRESNSQRNILFPWAILRFTMKIVLGVISLLIVSTNEKSKAIHDSIVGSVVIYAKSK